MPPLPKHSGDAYLALSVALPKPSPPFLCLKAGQAPRPPLLGGGILRTPTVFPEAPLLISSPFSAFLTSFKLAVGDTLRAAGPLLITFAKSCSAGLTPHLGTQARLASIVFEPHPKLRLKEFHAHIQLLLNTPQAFPPRDLCTCCSCFLCLNILSTGPSMAEASDNDLRDFTLSCTAPSPAGHAVKSPRSFFLCRVLVRT